MICLKRNNKHIKLKFQKRKVVLLKELLNENNISHKSKLSILNECVPSKQTLNIFDNLIRLLSFELKNTQGDSCDINVNLFIEIGYNIMKSTFMLEDKMFYFVEKHFPNFNETIMRSNNTNLIFINSIHKAKLNKVMLLQFQAIKITNDYINNTKLININKKNCNNDVEIDINFDKEIANSDKEMLLRLICDNLLYVLVIQHESIDDVIKCFFQSIINQTNKEIEFSNLNDKKQLYVNLNNTYDYFNNTSITSQQIQSSLNSNYSFIYFGSFLFFVNCIFNTIIRCYSYNDAYTVSFLEEMYIEYINHNNNISCITNDYLIQINKMIFDINRISENNAKIKNIISIIKQYISIILSFNDNNNTNNNINFTITSFIFSYLYCIENKQNNDYLKMHNENIHMKNKFNAIINFMLYSSFIINYLKTICKDELLKNLLEDAKYLCFYNYKESAGLMCQFGFVPSLVSCFMLKEIITLFKFDKLLSKALFSYFTFVYQVYYLYFKSNNVQQTIHDTFSDLFSWICIYSNKHIHCEGIAYGEYAFIFMMDSSFIQGIKINTKLNDGYVSNKTTKNRKATKDKNHNDNNNDNCNYDISNHLIALLNKIKYIQNYEQEVILKYIEHKLSNQITLQQVIQNKDFMDKINNTIGYLLFYNDFCTIDTNDANFPNMVNRNIIVFNIINKLLIQQPNEYFYFPKNVNCFFTEKEFLKYIANKNTKKITNSSIISYELLISQYHLNKYFTSINPAFPPVPPEINNSLYSFTYIIQYMFKLKETSSPYVSAIIKIINSISSLKDSIDLLYKLLQCGLYHIQIAIFAIYQMLIQVDIKIDFIISYLELLSQSDFKFHLFYFIYIWKFMDYALYYKIHQKEKDDPKKYYGIINILDNNKNVKAKKVTIIQSLYSNWKKVKDVLINKKMFINVINKLNMRNFPKICVNVLDKFIYDTMKEKNITNIKEYPDKELIHIYFNSLGKLDDNKKIMQLYFIDESLYNTLELSNTLNNKNSDNNNMIFQNINSLNQNSLTIVSIADLFFINNNYDVIKKVIYRLNTKQIGDIENLIRYLKLLCYIQELLHTNYYYEANTIYSSSIQFIEIRIAEYLNKTQSETVSNHCLLLILYEIYSVLVSFNISNLNKGEAIYKKENIREILYNIVIYRRLPYFGKYLINYKIRKVLCNLFQEHELEIICIKDIVKILKKSTSNIEDNQKQIVSYLKLYRNSLYKYTSFVNNDNNSNNKDNISKTISTIINHNIFYICLKYHLIYCPSQHNELESIFQMYTTYCTMYNYQPQSKCLKLVLKSNWIYNGLTYDDTVKELSKEVSLLLNDVNQKNEFCETTSLYLEQLYLKNETSFSKLKHDNMNLNEITFKDIDICIFEYLKYAIFLCIKTTNNKLLTKYLPEIINYFHKIQKASCNSMNGRNSSNNNDILNINSKDIRDIDKKKRLFLECIECMKEIEIKKIKSIIPQLLITYIYPGNELYELSVYLLSKYANQYIDLVAYVIGSFLSSSKSDIECFIDLKRNQNIRKKYEEMMTLSQRFANDIKDNLTLNNKKVLEHYVEFQLILKKIFLVKKKNKDKDNQSIYPLIDKIIKELNEFLLTPDVKIIVPTIANMNAYNPKVRMNDINLNLDTLKIAANEGGGGFEKNKKKRKNKKSSLSNTKSLNRSSIISETNNNNNASNIIVDTQTLYFVKMDSSYQIMDSKEFPIRVHFKTCLYHENINSSSKHQLFDFLLKGDMLDISKELKSFEFFDQVNNLFSLKRYDINLNMKLTRYLITPITNTIVLVEWLLNAEPLHNILTSVTRKYALKTYDLRIGNETTVRKGVIRNLPETYNVLYQYIHFKNPNPNQWYTYHLNYIISTAVWSMTGFIIGLGDRHPGNIMIHKNGEVIHIDFGYVLGKGKALPVPEIVDFRFTKNIRRCLGLFMENGLFVYVSKKILEMFKEYYSILRGRLEYFAFDPYFNEGADRETLVHLKEMNSFFTHKLTYGNSAKEVYSLIQKNGNYDILEKMYIGWSPML